MQRIEITSCEEKLKRDNFTIYTLKCADGQTYDCFEKLDPGTHEGTVQENANPQYNSTFKPKKDKKFGKNYDFEKRRVALECASSLVAAGKIDIGQISTYSDNFYKYLNQ
jgi:hypothetical protein